MPVNPRDPRLRLAAVLLSVQVLGQTVLDFKLSIAQILVSIGVGGLVDLVVRWRREGVLAWPASGMLTGNSVALLLRATGTDHGDWWSLNGVHYFVLAVLLGLASKYLVRPGGRHMFNPSNVGLVWILLVVGPAGVFPQYLWWGDLGVPVVLSYAVILAGSVWILRPLRMLPMALSFLVPYAVLVAAFAAGGASFWAIWHPEPVSGLFYFWNVALSPEVLIFAFFMISDPQTAPRAPAARLSYGALTALVAAGLLYVQPTEFGVKLGILSSLTVTCALVPGIEAVGRWWQRRQAGERAPAAGVVPQLGRAARALRTPAVIAAAIVAVAAPVNTALLADDEHLILIERGLSGDPDPQ